MTALLKFDRGSLVIEGPCEVWIKDLPGFVFDSRIDSWRSPAYYYRDIVLKAIENKIPLLDEARNYQSLDLVLTTEIAPREHQSAALSAWKQAGLRGVISLPTGAGKTILAILAILETKRPTLVVVPTIDLMNQWQSILQKFFGISTGQLGAGLRDFNTITVATYDSASMLVEKFGNMFGFLVFDECHHLPANQYQWIAKASIAPFRMGLSATLERADGREALLSDLIGEVCFKGQISEMLDKVLSPYDIVSVQVPLSEVERISYDEARSCYLQFVRRNRINFSQPEGWQEFIKKASILPGGKEAMEAYRQQKKLALGAEGKIEEIWRILQLHVGERIIIFTQDNAMAYQIGRTYILPVLTHQTKLKERKWLLKSFREGELDVLVTSKVLNEGVDVPDASVGIVVSGSGAVREHVQRLGRILRHREGKRARLYEIISKDTSEYYVNQRRRNHDAYQKPTEIYHSWR